MHYTLNRLFLSCVALSMMAASCTVTPPITDTTDIIAASAPKTVRLDFKKGQVLSLTLIENKQGDAAQAALAKYYEKAFPLADQFGLTRDMSFKVAAVPVGDFKPQTVVLFSWPSQTAKTQFQAHSDWPAIKDLRPKAWNELRLYDDVLKQDMSLTFDSAKTYTLAAAWINPANPNDYETYLTGIQTAVAEAGGRFIYKMHNPAFEAHASTGGAPDQVLLVEWDTAAGLQTFGQSAGFKAHAKYLGSGTRRFELAVLAPMVGS